MLTLQLVLCALVLILIVLVILFRPKNNNLVGYKLDDLGKKLDQVSASLREDLSTARNEHANQSQG